MSEPHYTDDGEKVPYLTRIEAENARRKMEEELGTRLKVYICPVCKSYHLAHKTRGGKRQRHRKAIKNVTV